MNRINRLVAVLAMMALLFSQTAVGLRTAVAAVPEQTSVPPAGAALPDPADFAALLTVLRPLAGWTMEKTVGTVAPFNMAEGQGVAFSFPPEKPVAGKFVPLTLWIMAGDYAGGTAPATTRPGTPIAGIPRELDRWNGRRVFLFDNGDKGWPNAVADIKRELTLTSGPLVASVVVENIDHKDTLQFELKNRAKETLNICQPYRGVPGIDVGYASYEVHFMMTGGRVGGSVLNHPITTLKPGETLHWPLTELQAIAPGATAKVDCGYDGINATEAQSFMAAKGVNVWAGAVIAPTVRVTVSKDGKTTVLPWSPAPLTAAEQAATLQVAAGMEAWMAQLKRDLAAVPSDAAAGELASDFQRDSHEVLRYEHCTLAHNCSFVVLGEEPMNFALDPPALAVKVTASCEGEWHGLALASEVDKITWDGKALRREYRIPGTDWIVTLAAQSNRPELLLKANSLLDHAYGQLSKLALVPPAPTQLPATLPTRSAPSVAPSQLKE